MKKRLIAISCILALVMCMSIALTACSKVDINEEDMMLVLSQLSNAYNNTKISDGDALAGSWETTDVKGEKVTVYIQWKVNGAPKISIDKANDKGLCVITFNSTITEATNISVTATLVNEKGKAYTDESGQPYTKMITLIAGTGTTTGGGGGGGTGGDNDQQGGGGTGGGTTTGNGTESSPYSVAEAQNVITQQNGDFNYSGKVYVKGVVTGTVSTGSSGDYKFDIVDSGKSNNLIVYYAAPNGKTVETGDTVVVSGSLVSYNGTKELTAHKDQNKNVITPCQIESVTKGTGSGTGGGQQGGGTTDDGGVTVNGKTITIDFAAMGYSNAQVVTSLTAGSLTLAFAKGATGKSDPAYYNSGNAFRLYGGNTMTITGATVTNIVFTFSTGEGTNEITVNGGTYSADAKTWTGSSSNLVFTIGGTSGHRRIAKMVITIA